MTFKYPKISFEVQKLTSEGQHLTFQDCFEAKMISKNILEYSRVIPAQFPYIEFIFKESL